MLKVTNAILSARDVTLVIGGRTILDRVNLDVRPNEIVTVIGPNGAGKSTTFRMMCGLTQPDSGEVFLKNVDVTQWPMYMRAKQGGMGYLPQQSSVFAKLSAEDNLRGIMQLLGFSRKRQKARIQELLDQFKIGHVRHTQAGRLSGGERRRLEIARCLISEPEIIMLDEPFAGIDPVTVQNIQVIIRELAQNGIAILITDHAAREILQITDRTYVVSEGKILVSGTTDEIVAHEEVKKKYLGDIEYVGPSSSGTGTPLSPHLRLRPDTARDESLSADAGLRTGTGPIVRPPAGSAVPLRKFDDFS